VYILILFFFFFASPVFSQSQFEQEKITPSVSIADSFFGRSSAISGDHLIVGTPWVDSGRAYIFQKISGNWLQSEILTPNVLNFGPGFGNTVAIDGNVAVVGTYYWENVAGVNSGTAFVFRKVSGNWVYQDQLLASDGTYGDAHGFSIAVSGDWIMVGAYNNFGTGFRSGAVFAYHYNGSSWGLAGPNGTRIENQKLTGSDSEPSDSFGYSVAMQGITAMIGAESAGDICPPNQPCNNGAVYVFNLNGSTWNETQIFSAPDTHWNHLFGGHIDFDGNWAVISAIWDFDVGAVTGSAYIYKKIGSSWFYEAEIHPWVVNNMNLVNWDWFSLSVSISGDAIVVGSAQYGQFFGVDWWVDGPGAAYVYQYNGINWHDDTVFLASDGDSGIEDVDGSNGDHFGSSVAISGDEVFVGAPRDDDACGNFPTCNSGAIYLFNLSGGPDPCPEDLNGNGFVEGADLAQLLFAWGENPGHPADFNGNGFVEGADLAQLLFAWGAC